MKALIIGISGQDGAYLARLLLEKGYVVHGTSRNHREHAFPNLEILGIRQRVQLSSMMTSDFKSVFESVQQSDADEIYHLSGQSSVGASFNHPVETFESILNASVNILESLRLLKKQVRFCNAGSGEIFGNTTVSAAEGAPFNPRSPYASAKAAAHYAVGNYREAFGLHVSTGILFNHESPLRPQRFVTGKIVSTAVRIFRGSGETLHLGKIDLSRDWGWAPDYVEAMWLMLQQEVPDDYVIATGESHSIRDFVAATFAKLGLDWRDHVEVDPGLFRPSDIEFSCGDPSKAKRVLEWEAKHRFERVIQMLVEASLVNIPNEHSPR